MNLTYFLFFICIVICTLIITYWAAKRSGTTRQFYTAAGSLTGLQNGMAIAGDYISAASFLGIVGAISLSGYDGFMYSIGFLISYVIVLFLVAEPVHHLGQYSIGDVICARFPNKNIRMVMGFGTFIISILYMIPQLVAAGLLIRLLLDINYSISVLIIGGLMTMYVVFGGMIATSWVQIIKTVLLMSGTFLLSLSVFSRFNWNVHLLIEKVTEQSVLGTSFFFPGHLFSSPWEVVSLQLALILGTAGLPHILIRLYTVRNRQEVRRSLVTSMGIIGLFYMMTLVLGLGTIALVGYERLIESDPTGNLAAPLLAKEIGGDFLLAFISAIAFTTIMAVVSGLVISATTSVAHDIYHHVIKKGQATEKEQLRVAQLSALFVGFISTMVALGLENMNVTFLVSLTFIVAAASNFPVLFLTIYWKRFNQTGVITGMICGLVASLTLLMLGPQIMDPVHGWIRKEASIPLNNPGMIAIPIGFLGAVVGSFFGKKQSEETFTQFYFKAETNVTARREHE